MGACGLTRALLAELLQRSTMNWARWCQPRLGPVNPELCLNVAERYRQISSIAEAMRALTLRSCHFLNQFLNPGPQSGPSIGALNRERPQIRLYLNSSPSKPGAFCALIF